MFFLFRGVELFLDSQNIPLVGFRFVLRVLQLFLGKQLFVPHPLGASIIRFQHFRFGLPVSQVRRNTPGFCSRGFEVCRKLAVIQSGQYSSGANSISRFGRNGGDNSVALRHNIHLMFHDQGRGNRKHLASCSGLRGIRLRHGNRGRNSGSGVRLRVTAS